MPGLQFVTDLAELDRHSNDWDRLARQRLTYFPPYEDARRELASTPFLAAIYETVSGVQGLASFVSQRSLDQFAIGERHLFSAPVRETQLYGGGILGSFGDGADLGAVVRRGLSQWPCDLFTLGEVDRQSPLIAAAAPLPGVMPIRRTRNHPIRWLIPLPPTFDDYLKSLRPSTRKAIGYAIRHFARECELAHDVISKPSQVEEFLREAERISRKTYQWGVGDRIINDEPTRVRYRQLAEEGRFRGLLLRVGGQTCAFAHGAISGDAFVYETPGFDPQWRRYSPGVVALALTIREAIEQTGCKQFDFGPGGDTDGYKARFGTFAIPSVSLQFACLTRARGLSLYLGHAALSLGKGLASGLLPGQRLRQRLRKAVRRYNEGG